MKLKELDTRINQLIELGNKTVETTVSSNEIIGLIWVNSELFNEFRSASLSFLRNVFDENNPYYKEFNNNVKDSSPGDTKIGIGILKAVLGEIKGGWIFTAKELISAEIFSSFLEMAEYLLKENYKDAAAVMIGSVLEGHLKHLCEKNNIPTYNEKDGKEIPKKADGLNSELTKKEIYKKLDQKLVTSRLDLRNNAAHGHYDEYRKEQVQNMYSGILDFITRTSS